MLVVTEGLKRNIWVGWLAPCDAYDSTPLTEIGQYIMYNIEEMQRYDVSVTVSMLNEYFTDGLREVVVGFATAACVFLLGWTVYNLYMCR